MRKRLFFVLGITVIAGGLVGFLAIIGASFVLEKKIVYAGRADLEVVCRVSEVQICGEPFREYALKVQSALPHLPWLKIRLPSQDTLFFELSSSPPAFTLKERLASRAFFFLQAARFPFILPPELVPSLPPDLLFSYASKNFLRDFLEWKNEVQKTSPLLATSIDVLLKSFEEKYRISFLEVLPFMTGAHLLVFPEEQIVLILELSSTEGEALATFAERAVSHFLASRFPKEVVQTLPDNTTAVELFFDPGIHQFSSCEESFPNIEVCRYLSHPPYEFFLLRTQTRLIFSTSRQKLLEVLSPSPEFPRVQESVRRCFGRFAPDREDSFLFATPEGWLVASSVRGKKGPKVQGCFVDELWTSP